MKLLVLIAFFLVSCFPKPQPEDPVEPIPQPPEKNSCVHLGSYNFTKPGPYKVIKKTIGKVKVFEPQVNKECLYPIFHFSNGTGAPCAYYDSINKHLASYGYLALCYESTQTGSGNPCMNAINTAIGAYNKKIDIAHFSSSGHSQGGGAAHTCQYLFEQKYEKSKTVSIGIAPAHGMNRGSFRSEYPKIKGPVFMQSGNIDTTVPKFWVNAGFTLVKSEKFWFEAIGANHFNPHNWGKVAAISFSNWKLFNDEISGKYFLALPQSQYWRKIK